MLESTLPCKTRLISIGLATAKEFAQVEAAGALVETNGDHARTTADKLVATKHKAISICCNAANVSEVEAMVKQTISTFGRLNVVFNNAGIPNIPTKTADTTVEKFD